jgi:predicted nuclease of restriction endonuclease-like (RecB) superfamily
MSKSKNMERLVDPELFSEVKALIEQSRQTVAVAVNSTMTMLYWEVGRRINAEVLNDQRAEYGKQIVVALSAQLTSEYGKGWSTRHLHHCLRFADVFPDVKIVNALRTQLSWTHLRTLISINEELKRSFYIEMCRLEKWSTRMLSERINSMLYERTAISKKPELTIENELKLLGEEGRISPDLVFRDPYFLDFLDLKDTYSEKDLESAIIAELQRFIIEMGTDFAFLSRQKRISIDHRDYYIDLLFYHRRLKSLVVIDLKMGEFDAAYKGEMELYLAWLEKHETVEGENPPIGLILCAGKNPEHVELLQLHKSNIKVADYFTVLPSKQVLMEKYHQAIAIARNNLTSRNE